MPYDKNTGRWKHPGGTCSMCNSLGYIVTPQELNSNEPPTAWKCNCHIAEDRALKFAPYQNRDLRIKPRGST